jgi:16S rRNA (uracil1498-N3)-methyltransferase
MTDRYFAETPITGGKARLVGPEAHHLIHVMRVEPGEEVVLFDGSGAEFAARVERVHRSEAELTVLSRHEADRELALEVTLGVALPKGERQRWLVEKAVELGVKRLVPLGTERSVVRPGERTLARLCKTVIEASKQCGRNRLMEIAQSRAWPDFVAGAPVADLRLVAHPRTRAAEEGQPSGHVPSASTRSRHTSSRTPDSRAPTAGCEPEAYLSSVQPSQAVVLAVGPEGGFTEEEVAVATSAGWRLVDLGPRTLRTETAAILLAALAARGR